MASAIIFLFMIQLPYDLFNASSLIAARARSWS